MNGLFINIPGYSRYEDVWKLQRRIHDLRVKNEVPDTLIFTEHEHVYTIGKAGGWEDLKVKKEFLNLIGAEVYEVDRGGKVTYHGPGQIVGYPIFNLVEMKLDLHKFLRKIEEAIILTLLDYGVKAERISGLTGVWVDGKKIASIGIKVSRWVSMHGFAFNVSTELKFFDWIFPCGLKDVEMVSLERLIGKVDISDVKLNLLGKFEDVFGIKFDEVSVKKLTQFEKTQI